MATFEGMTEEDQLSTLMAELKDSNIRQSVMEYIANKSEVTSGATDKQRLSKMIETIAAESVTNQKQSALWKSRTKKSVLLGIAAVIVAITVQFLVNFFSNELSKESHVSGKGTMVGTDGSVVKTEMNEMRVNADGQLQGRSSVKTIKTTPSLNKIALASSLPDSTLLALDEVTVYSDRGHTLRIKVMGFARVPVLNSRCGNLVHFYSAQGRITLDSTDISFDKDSEAQFKDAGFSLAVGGYGGRRLAGMTKAQGFFKHVDKLRKSGAWTCADVALPVILPKTSIVRESLYRPCLGHDCYSKYGGLKLGVAKLEAAHALAAMPITSRLRSLLKGSASEAYYMRREMTTLVSEAYTLQIETWPQHFGQEKIELSSHKTGETADFQSEIGAQNIAHCRPSKEEVGQRALKWLGEEPEKAAHLEFLGLVEESGKVLRHWRLHVSLGRGQSDKKLVSELWDFADTMVPYRSLSTDGEVSVTESFTSKCTDADVSEALALRTSVTLTNLLVCKVKTIQELPLMFVIDEDLDEKAFPHYMAEVFGSMDAARRVALAADGEMSTLADYLLRAEEGESKGSVSDPCYLACKNALDADAAETRTCQTAKAAKECLQNSHSECVRSPWMTKRGSACLEDFSPSTRALEDESEEDEQHDSILVPATQNGVADLTRASPSFQAALASTLLTRTPKMVLNVTRKRRLATRGRRLVGVLCWAHPKAGRTNRDGKMFQWGINSRKLGGGNNIHAGHMSKSCPSCRWGPCAFAFKTIHMPISGLKDPLGTFMCLSFSFCVQLGTHKESIMITIFFKWNKTMGYWVYSIILSLCYQWSVFGIGMPFALFTCAAGEMHVFWTGGCPAFFPLVITGGGYLEWSCTIFFHLGPFNFSTPLIVFKIKVETGETITYYELHCWRDERRRRNGFNWEPRRRNKRKCHHGTRCRTWTKISVHFGIGASFLKHGLSASITFTDTKYTDQDQREGKVKINTCLPFCQDWHKWDVYSAHGPEGLGFGQNGGATAGYTYKNKAWDKYRQDTTSWIAQMEAHTGETWDGVFDNEAKRWHDDPAAMAAYVQGLPAPVTWSLNSPVWNPDAMCCNPVCHTAEARSVWLQSAKDYTEDMARQFVMLEFPDQFRCWNPDAMCCNPTCHTAEARSQWLQSAQGQTLQEARLGTVLYFANSDPWRCWNPEVILYNGAKAQLHVDWLVKNKGNTVNEARQLLMNDHAWRFDRRFNPDVIIRGSKAQLHVDWLIKNRDHTTNSAQQILMYDHPTLF